MPGKPLPAEPSVPGLLELAIIPAGCMAESGETGAEEGAPEPPDGSRPLCRLSEEGFWGVADDGAV